jgi:hypothetical protein
MCHDSSNSKSQNFGCPNFCYLKRALSCFALVLTTCLASESFGQQMPDPLRPIRNNTISVRPCDQIWLLSIRGIGLGQTAIEPIVQQLGENLCWQIRPLRSLTSDHLADKTKKTVFYIHGWRTDETRAIRQGMDVYRSLIESNAPPVRLVIFEWQADKSRVRFKRDYVEKSNKAVLTGGQLNFYLRQFQDRDITLISHSLGSQVVLASLMQPSGLPWTAEGYQLVLTASAIDCGFNLSIPSKCTPESQVAKTLVINSSRDLTLWLGNRKVCQLDTGVAASLKQVIDSGTIPLGQICWRETDEIRSRHDISYYAGTSQFHSLISNYLVRENLNLGLQLRSSTNPQQ